MVLTEKYLKRKIKEGNAVSRGTTVHFGWRAEIVDRYDLQRTDHYVIERA